MDLKVITKLLWIYSLVTPSNSGAPFIPVSKLIYDFLLNKHLHSVTLFVCWKTETLMSFSRRLMSKRIRVNAMSHFPSFLDEVFPVGQVHYQAIILDGDCSGSHDMLKNADSRLFDATYHWLIICYNRTSEIQQKLRNINLNINTVITLAFPSVKRQSGVLDLHEIYNPGFDFWGQMKMNFLGTWSISGKFSWTDYALRNLLERRRDMTGVIIKSMVVVTARKVETKIELMNYLASYENLDHDLLTRYEYKLLAPLEKFLNLTIDYIPTNSWGYKLENGSFDGAIGAMIKGEAELSASATQFNLVRFPHIDGTAKILDFKQCFIFRHPSQEGLSVTEAFLKPYATNAWLASTACAVLLLILLRYKANYELIAHEHSWSSASIILIAAICQQGADWSPRSASGRILLLYMLIFTMLFYQFYSAILVSTFLMEPARTITNMENLIDSNLQIEIEDIIYLHNYFATIDFGSGLKIYKKKIEHKASAAFVKPLTGLQHVQKGGVAYIGDIAKAHMIIKRTFTDGEICDLQTIPLMTAWQMFVILRKGSTFKKIFTFGLRRIIEAGIVKRELIIWDAKKPDCVVVRTADDIGLNLDATAMPFLLLAAGILLSILILILEKLYHLRGIYRRTNTKISTR